MEKTLPLAKKSIDDFIAEANECATRNLGFAATATVFAVILAVSESIYRHTKAASASTKIDDKKLFKEFVPYVKDKSWLVARGRSSALSDQDIATDLYQVRNGLSHQLSLPSHIGMINTLSEAKKFFAQHSAIKHLISVAEFVTAVDGAVNDIIRKYPGAVIDSKPRGGPRSPAEQVILQGNISASRPS